MKMEENVSQVIRDSLESLCNQIETLVPTAICSAGDMTVNESLQIYASFLKTPQSETLDLCVVLKHTETGFLVSADLVKGGTGKVLSEITPLVVSSQARATEIDGFLEDIRRFIFSQQDKIIQYLHE